MSADETSAAICDSVLDMLCLKYGLYDVIDAVGYYGIESNGFAIRCSCSETGEPVCSWHYILRDNPIDEKWNEEVEAAIENFYKVAQPKQHAALVGVEHNPELERLQALHKKVDQTIEHDYTSSG
jgi:hypothetical protein